MSIPAIIAAEIGIGMMDLIVLDAATIVAMIFAFVFGLLTIKLFLKAAEKIDFSIFCIALGLLSALALLL